MIYDCFLFHNEVELLELRLMELNSVVDKFVLCESTHTFTGKSKPLHFADNCGMFERWEDKIIYVLHTGAKHDNPWLNEYEQRDYLAHGLHNATDDDVVVLSDVDEIPNKLLLPSKPPLKPVVLKQRLYYYYVNCFQAQPWYGSCYGKRSHMIPLAERRRRLFPDPKAPIKSKPWDGDIAVGGWHFSWLGGIRGIHSKLESYSEVETNTDDIRDEKHIQHCLETGADLFNRRGNAFKKMFVPLNDTFPKALPLWLKKYPEMYRDP